MSFTVSRRLKPTPNHSVAVSQTAFRGIKVQNQPDKPLYTQTPRNKYWFEDTPLKTLMSVVAYINVGNKVGFGLNDKAVNWNKVPWFMDRASPFFWF